MYHRSIYLALGATLSLVAGCWNCDRPCGTTAGSPPCKLVGNGKPIPDSCYDAVTGAPVPCPPPGAGMLIPGGYQPGPVPQPMAPGNELPAPGETIPPANIPNAQPFPAPGYGISVAPNMVQPVKR